MRSLGGPVGHESVGRGRGNRGLEKWRKRKGRATKNRRLGEKKERVKKRD